MFLAVWYPAVAQPPITGVYQFEDSSYAALGIIDENPVAIFSNGEVRGLRKVSLKAFELGNALALFDAIEGSV